MHPSLTSPSLNTDKVFECTSYDFICLGLVNGFIFVHLRESERLSCSIHGNFSVCWELCIVRRLYLAAFHFFLFPWFQILLFFFPSPLSTCALDVLMADRRIPDFAKTLTVSTPPFPWNFPGRVGQQWPSCTESRRATTTPLKILVTVIPISVRRIK